MMDGFERIDEGASAAKKGKRDGKRQCPFCKERIGIRSKKCEKCKRELKRKEKDWQEIAAGSSADGNYIKEKLFKRMDQLSTVPGWTGVVFLVHENEIRAGQKRVYTHSYSTRGAGRRIELAMREKVLNSMKILLNMGEKDPNQSEETTTPIPAAAISTPAVTSTSSQASSETSSQSMLSSSMPQPHATTHATTHATAHATTSLHTSLPLSSIPISVPPTPSFVTTFIPSANALSLTSQILQSTAHHHSVSSPPRISPSTAFSNSQPSTKSTSLAPSLPPLIPRNLPPDSCLISTGQAITTTSSSSFTTITTATTTTSSTTAKQVSKQLPGKVIEIGGRKFFVLNQSKKS